MAREALTIAGAAIGTAIGGPIGGQIGFLIGSIAGAYLFPPDPIRGPKLDDRRIQTSSYGMPVPVCYGTIRAAGVIIWAPDLEEHTEQDEVGKGPGQEVETTSYYADVAILICDGPIDGVTRIWADDELILDRRASNEGAAQLPNLKFRLYLGTESQEPDPLIEEVEGVGNVPAWRGKAYIVIYDFAVGRYGNRLPNFAFEVVADLEPAYPIVDVGSDTGLTGINLDPVTNQIVTMGATFQRIDTFDNEVLFSKTNPLGSGSYRGNPCLQPDGKYYYQIYFEGSLESFHAVYKVDAFTGESVGSVGNDTSVGALPGAENSAVIQIFTIPGGLTPEGVQVNFYRGVAWDDSWVFIWECNGDTLPPTYYSHFRVTTDLDHGLPGSTQAAGVAITPDGFVWAGIYTAAGSPNVCKLLKISCDIQADPEANATVLATYDLSTYIDTVLVMTYDPSENALIILGDTISGAGSREPVLKFDLDSESVTHVYRPTATAAFGTVSNWATWQQGVINGRLYLMDGGGDFHVIQTSDMTLVEEVEFTNYTSLTPFDTGIYDPISDAVWMTLDTETEVKKLLWHRGNSGSTTLRAILTDIADRCGYDVTGAPTAASPDINVVSQTQVVRGFAWQLASARAVVEQLLRYFAVDWIEQDGLLKGVNRGAASVATLDDDDDFGAHDPRSGTPLDSLREPFRVEDDETELPLSLTVNYLDVNDDYATGSQIARRVAEAVDAIREELEAFAIAATADEAAQVAERRLWERWVGRWKYEGNVDWGWLRLNASDPVTIADNDDSIRVRLTSVAVGDNLIMNLKGEVEDSTSLYTSTAVGQSTTGSGSQPTPLPIPGAAFLVLMDTLPLREADDSFGHYYALGSYRDLDVWQGGIVKRSNDGLSYVTIDTVPNVQGAKVGRATTALAVPSSPFEWDYDNSVTVAMHNGTLSSSTAELVSTGANWAWLGSAAGRGEIIGFVTATDNGDGTYTLSELLRGRRHTDDQCDAPHEVGEVFVLLTLETTRTLQADEDERDEVRYFKAHSLGWTGQEPPVPFTNTGRRLKPPRVTDIEGDRTGSPSGLTVTWIRRDRLSWNALLGPFYSNSDDPERYEIDVMLPGSPDTVVRTLTSDNPAVFYSDAQQTTDFGSVPASVTVRIYQISPTVGRGIMAEATV